jgi:hypothetical protein
LNHSVCIAREHLKNARANGARELCPSNDSQAPLRHRKWAGTVASFRTWRGSRRSLAQDPAISGGHRHARDAFSSAEQLEYHSATVANDSEASMWTDDSRESAPPGIILKMEIGKILPKLLKLPSEQRAELATQLIRSLDESEDSDAALA